jgi:AcrR family transcriptional regulator
MGSTATTTTKAPRRKPGRPAAEAATPTEAEILATGMATFAELGFDATTVRELAQRLSVSHNFINDRYGNKELFWRAVVDNALGADMHQHLMEVLGAAHPTELDRLTAVIRFAIGRANPVLHKLLSREATQASPRLDYIVERYIQPMVIGLTPVMAALVRDGVIRPVPWSVLLFLMGAPAYLQAQAPLAGLLGEPAAPRTERDVELFTSLILNALRPVPEAASSSSASSASSA